MKISFLLLFSYTILPYIGIYYFDLAGMENTYGSADLIILPYTLYLLVFYFTIALTYFFSKKNLIKTDNLIGFRKSGYVMKNVIILQLLCIVGMFFYGADSIWSGDIGRGEFRSTLGGSGFLYLLFASIIPSATFAISAFCIRYDKLANKYLFLLSFAITAFIGLLSGFKFTAILNLSAGIIILSDLIKFKHTILLIIGGVGMTILSATLFMGLDFETAFGYIIFRATSISVSGSVAVWNTFGNGGDDAWMTLLYALGNNLASFVLGVPTDSVEFLKVNLTRLIGYLTYPLGDEALSGAYNMTVTNFGEAVYLFGSSYCYLYAIPSGWIVSKIIIIISNKSASKVNIVFGSTYLTLVVFPWLMNSMVANLIGLPTLFYFGVAYILITLCFKINLFKSFFEKNNPLKDQVHALRSIYL